MPIRSPPYFFETLDKDVARYYSTKNQEIGDLNHA